MKYLVLIFLFTLSLYAKEQKVTLGLGAYIQTQPYKDVKPILIPSPVIFFDNSIFYIRWSRAGLYFLGDKGDKFSWGFSLTVQPRTFHYSPDDSKYLEGMDERKSTVEGGLAYSMQYEKKYLEIMLLTDVLKHHEAWILKAEFGDEFTFNKLILYPSVIVTYQSSDFVNYYYGVTEEESQKTSYEVYKPTHGYSVGLQTYAKYPITDKLSILLNARVDKMPSSASSSPIVEVPYIYSGLASLIYTFTY